MRNKSQNEKGMTLVELLAAIVLLGIILVAFMSFFTQSAKFTAHNHETLTAVQVAEQVVAEVRTISKIEEMKKSINTLQGKKITDDITYTPYVVTIEEVEAPASVKENLKKAIITVKSISGAGINEPEFKTEMYIKVK
ncbi:prepilin-type N-terminal cleavage/methylation domain-containing protein [Planococcus liqunii]|uniref:prepilin-type N-terminal cleavage/methylation domain-containing protein n=1 Tax=Planococcus liqunii TaxID=3058394 RepID=UPI002624D423|nr:prepilin-type N-terminal cleavage/methylation domain-containing protein [Planococcus sp. N056]WKA52391.1 prepilin-type N-terminal cleavage/methylation domain-containing protein [Planococcus sp. N056]